MWGMRCAKGYLSLSKGTQSDGLISDTSTEGFTSSSSTENLKEGKIFEKAVEEHINIHPLIAKETEKAQNELQNSIHLKPSTSLHQIEIQYQLYIKWGVLISFGILLWVALWITDIFNPNPFLKQDVATAKKVTIKAGIAMKSVPSTWRLCNLWSYASSAIISVTTLEILIFICCVTILVCLKPQTKNKWGGTIRRLCYNLLNTGEEQTETDRSNFHCNILEVLAPKETEIDICGDSLSKFSHGDVRNLTTQDETKVKSKLEEKRTQYLNQRETSSIENHISKSSLRTSHNINNTRKRSLPLNHGKNYYNFSRRSNHLSRDTVTSEPILDKPDFDLSCASPISKNNKRKFIPEQSDLTCSIFNKSTSFMSEEIESWFELPNSDQPEKVMHSFNMELEEFFKTRSNSSPLSVAETTHDLQRFNTTSIGCEYGKQSGAVILNVDYNGGIVSSSPAFRRFLVNLAKDRLSESYL